MAGFQPHFDIDFERGKVGEDLVGTFLEALEGSKIEVKTDYRIQETGNVYVETHQWRNPNKSDIKESGINVTQAEWFVFASPTGKGFIAMQTDELKKLMADIDFPEGSQRVSSSKTMASVGKLVTVKSILMKLKLAKYNTL
jgi:hypothetical protein